MPDDDETPRSTAPEWDESRVALNVLGKLIDEHPDWRLTQHTTPGGRQVMMIEFADGDGEYTGGLPGDFITMVSEAGDPDA